MHSISTCSLELTFLRILHLGLEESRKRVHQLRCSLGVRVRCIGVVRHGLRKILQAVVIAIKPAAQLIPH